MEIDQNKATHKIYHQAYYKFQEYNLLVKLENKKNLGSQSETLPDPDAMPTIKKIFGQDYKLVTDVFSPYSASWPKRMKDRQVMLYMIQLQRWIQNHIRPDSILHLKDIGILTNRRKPSTTNERPRLNK